MVAGEGGFLLTKNEYYLERAIIPGQHTRRLASAKMSDDLALFHVAGGMWNYRMHPVAAAIATTQLAKLPAMNAARRANFERLVTGTADIPFLSWPREEPDCERGWYGAPAVYDTARAGGVTLLKNRVTGVVDLGGVPALPVAESAPAEWDQYANGTAEAVR